MKKELTIGDILAVLVIIIGWAISVEVRFATAGTQTQAVMKTVESMSKKIDEIHDQVIRHDERINADLPQIVTRGGEIHKNKK